MDAGVSVNIDLENVVLKGNRRQVRQGFEQVVRRYMKDAYRVALGLVGSHEDALELSQEAFYRAYKNLHLLRSEAKFFPWFYQILRNLCFSWLRAKKTHTAAMQAKEQVHAENRNVGLEFSPDLLAQRSETRDAVWKAISTLDDKHREILILYHFQNLRYGQIANVLMCSKGTVMSRLYHARKQLKERLEKQKGVLEL